jgi:uncharacterized circularly permuted ATP-grasp superfamily protein/uncharacterized alpha-E superfamily protein
MSDEPPVLEEPHCPALDPLLPSYRVPSGHFDELLSSTRIARPAWNAFASHAGDLTVAHLADAEARVLRQIHENGVTYNVYASEDGPARPWAVDVLPFIVPAAEWETLSSGLRQRARLLNAITADLYGPQTLLREGLIPPALVFGHPGFLRACHGVVPPKGIFLHQIAFDLARAADGEWRVVGTRTQAPSGAGYALENRITISRLFPEAFREMRVQLLAPFFRSLQETLLGLAPSNGDTPHVVLLTPGPYNETYFEHAYLARYLGFPLVEGGDLVVRDDRVYLKTVTGLRRVHAVLRRLDDDFCDPLELRADSTLGVPGLVHAWRAGHVVVANAFGAGVLESPALLGFLPAVCQRLFGEPLATRSIATWWCGEAAALADIGPRLENTVIKRAFAGEALEPVFLASLDQQRRDTWRARLAATPEQFVAEEYLPLSHAPVWQDRRLEARALMLRVYLVANGRGDYLAMPGGLTRIAGADHQIVSGQRGGSSKDTWVLSESPVERFSLLSTRLRQEDLAHGERMVSSRAAENLFWLGRYAERSENCARLLRAVLSRLPDSDAFSPGPSRVVVETCTKQGLLSYAVTPQRTVMPAPTMPTQLIPYAERPGALEVALIDGMFARQSCHSLAFNVEQTVRVAGTVRDRLSSDNWRLLNQLLQAMERRPSHEDDLAEALELLDRAIISLVAVGGLEMAHMTRDHGWRFLSLGRHLERLLYVSTTVADVAASQQVNEPMLLEWLLDLSDSIITYRARHMRLPEWAAVTDLLLFDRRNPRSAAFQLAKLGKHVRLLPQAELTELVEALDRACLIGHGSDSTQGELFERSATLDRFLASCEMVALALSDALTLTYFSHVSEISRATLVL